ncbi:TPA: hypothetical protein I9781_001196 [Legionella pneumophila]|nr:hypothetical protein [Legionella pneumophila]HAT1942819.1 hypothetical protein [Legionella pneumophila]HAT3858873.1 hypothetical protein [Legionella pneumophila]HAT3862185.1 hypothetical protein [Legionella pneumophila]HAT3867583.1 hypothetical protein [Legionella pneumophila]HAT3878319.1 hypothetical protein [Legionella pneumophila]
MKYKFLNIDFIRPQTHRFKNLVVDHIGKLYLMKLGELGKQMWFYPA